MTEPNLINGNWEQTIAHYLQQIEPINGSWLQAIAYALANLPTSSSFLTYNVTDYSTLLATATGATNGQFAYIENAQGTQWLPGSLGGTYYGSGLYYYSGGIWHNDLPQIQNQLYLDTISLNSKADISGATFTSGISTGSFYYITAKSDLPTASGGIITLNSNATYYFTTTVDLLGDRIVAGQNSVILGASSENSYLKSTGLSASTALITSNYSLPIRNISFTHDKVFDLDGDGITTALDWFGINFVDCANVGTIKDYSNFILADSAFLNSSGLIFDGTIGTIGINNTLFDGQSASTVITLPSTLIVSRRFRIINSSFITSSGETGINVSTGVTISDERYILDTLNFAGGGTYITGVDQTSNKSLFINCVGITNTAVNGQVYMHNNSTATVVGSSNTFYKVSGTTTPSADNSKVLSSNNRLTVDAAVTRKYLIHCDLSFNSGTNDVCEFGFYDSKLGTVRTPSKTKSTANSAGRAENISFACVVQFVQGDYLEIHCANTSGARNITVTDLNFIVTEIR